MGMITNKELLEFNTKIAEIYTRVTSDIDLLFELCGKYKLIDKNVFDMVNKLRLASKPDLFGLLAHMINIQELIKHQLANQEELIIWLKSGKDILDFKSSEE